MFYSDLINPSLHLAISHSCVTYISFKTSNEKFMCLNFPPTKCSVLLKHCSEIVHTVFLIRSCACSPINLAKSNRLKRWSYSFRCDASYAHVPVGYFIWPIATLSGISLCAKCMSSWQA